MVDLFQNSLCAEKNRGFRAGIDPIEPKLPKPEIHTLAASCQAHWDAGLSRISVRQKKKYAHGSISIPWYAYDALFFP